MTNEAKFSAFANLVAEKPVLAMSGAHTVREATQSHAELLAALGANGDLLLDCTGVTEADLSFVQMILAAHRSATARGSHFALNAPPAGALRSVLERGGFARPLETDPSSWIASETAP